MTRTASTVNPCSGFCFVDVDESSLVHSTEEENLDAFEPLPPTTLLEDLEAGDEGSVLRFCIFVKVTQPSLHVFIQPKVESIVRVRHEGRLAASSHLLSLGSFSEWAAVGITGVNAGPCKPITVSSGSSAEAAATSALTASSSATSSSTDELSSSIQSSTDLTTETETTTIAESSITADSTTTGSIEFTSTVISVSESTIATTIDFTSALTETTSAAATTSAVADIPCNNQIYRGTAQNRGYTSTNAQSEAHCWEACFADEQCNTWFFQTAGICQLYREQFDTMSSPRNEASNLTGSRNCSPRDYSSCGDNIGFGSISASPIESVQQVLLEEECAQLWMKDGSCDVWQYDGMLKTCHKLTGEFEDLFTAQADAQGDKIPLAGSRSCSSDFFKPQLEPWNNQINTWGANPPWGYKSLGHIKTVPECARACSIDPQYLSWGLPDGGGSMKRADGCDLSKNVYGEDHTDFAAAGSRNCGVP